jgi:predicted nuclease of predicted toxin-antitoxin system
MLAALYADENMPRQVIEALRRLDHDVLTCHEAGNAGRRIPDEHVLRFAIEHGRAVLTMDRRDFLRLHRRVPDHAGIVACTRDDDCERQASRIHDAIVEAGDLRGKFILVTRPSGG